MTMHRIRHSAEDISPFEGKISTSHFAILTLAAATNYVGIAEALGVPIGTVKSRLNRARAALDKARATAVREPPS